MYSQKLLWLATVSLAFVAGCWELSNPNDPSSCVEICGVGQRCVAGACVDVDAGAPVDAAAVRWSAALGSKTGDDHVSALACAPDGLLVAGRFDAAEPSRRPDGFIARYDDSGATTWVMNYQGGAGDYFNALAFDPKQGRVIVGGSFQTTLTLDKQALQSSGYDDALLFSLDGSSGNLDRWRQYGGKNAETIQAALLRSNRLVLAGSYQHIGFSLGERIFEGRTGNDGWIGVFDAGSWEHHWSLQLGGSGNESISAIAIDTPGRLFVAGSFDAELTLRKAKRVSRGSGDALLVAYDQVDGSSAPTSEVWSATIGSVKGDTFQAVDQANGAVYAAGYLGGSALVGTTELSFGGGASDALVAAFSRDGALRWSLSFGGTGADQALGVLALDDGVLIGGYFEGSFELLGQQIQTDGRDGFLLRLDANGNLRWLRQIGGPGSQMVTALLACGDAIYVGGGFEGTGPGGEGSRGGMDSFVIRIEP
jgi:hypothetical protein